MRRKILIGLIAFFLAGTLCFFFWFPRYVEGRIEDSLLARGDALGFETELADVDVSWSGSVDVEALRFKGEKKLGMNVSIPELSVTTGNVALFERRVSLSQVYLNRAVIDFVDLERSQKWWKARESGAAGSSSKGGLIPTSFAGFTIDRKPMPTLEVRDLMVKLPMGVLENCSGQVRDKALTLDVSHLILHMECTFRYSGMVGRVKL